jgi:hypothetical protein
MGGIMQSIFGGSRSKSSSTNRAFEQIRDGLTPTMERGNTAGEAIMALLGLGGDPEAQEEAMRTFAESSGQDFIMDQGSRAITGNAAAKGFLGSGPTLRALMGFGQDRGRTFVNDYLDRVSGVQDTGLKGAATIAGAGQQSSSSSSTKPGIGKFLGSVVGGIAGG